MATPTTAAVVLEPVQGEAGCRAAPPAYLRLARELTRTRARCSSSTRCRPASAGPGTGSRYQQAGIVPDAITLAKGLGGGVPIGALVTFGDVAGLLTVGQHGSTFGGNPLAAAAGLAVIDTIEERGPARARAGSGPHLADAVAACGIRSSPGCGGRVCSARSPWPTRWRRDAGGAARDAGFIVNPVAPDALRLAPPLILTQEQADTFVAALPGILDVAVLGATPGLLMTSRTTRQTRVVDLLRSHDVRSQGELLSLLSRRRRRGDAGDPLP